MIPIANGLMYTGLTVGLLGIGGCVILVYRALRDAWEKRHAKPSASIREIRGETKYTFNRHRLTP